MLNDWIRTREAFTDWVATTPLRNLIEDDSFLYWRGMSLWWALNLTQKDNFHPSGWYKELHIALGKNSQEFLKEKKIRYSFSFCSNQVGHLIKRVFLNLLIKFTFKKNAYDNRNKFIWFHSLSYNLNVVDGVTTDRLYDLAPYKDDKYGENAAFILKFFPSGRYTIKKWVNEIRKLSLFKRKYYISDHFISIYEIISIYYYCFKAKNKIIELIKNNENKNLFIINNLDVKNLLLPYLIESFNGRLQDSLIYALSMSNAFKKLAPDGGTVITYGELLPMFKPVCHELHKKDNRMDIIAIQHAYTNKNKLASYYRNVEFDSSCSTNYSSYSPKPDLYLTQGAQFSKILSSYFDEERIKIIGCLKFDRLGLEASKSSWLDHLNDKKKILIAPSLGDEVEMIEILNKSRLIKNYYVIYSPHPISDNHKFSSFLRELLGDQFIMSPTRNTIDIVSKMNLVITGYSSIAIESRIYNVDSVRLYSFNNPPMIDEDDPIKIIKSGVELDMHLSMQNAIIRNNKEIVESIFYSIDGCVADRMWKEVLNYKITSKLK